MYVHFHNCLSLIVVVVGLFGRCSMYSDYLYIGCTLSLVAFTFFVFALCIFIILSVERYLVVSISVFYFIYLLLFYYKADTFLK